MDQRMYELAILKEISDRIGYSLDVQKIVEIITGSLNQFLDYSAVAYMLLDQDILTFKAHLEERVPRKFIDEVKERMLQSFSALANRDLAKLEITETISGAIVSDEREMPVRSFFNIPLVIGDRAVGVLTIAHTKVGLYREEEMTILYKIVAQASNAVTRLQEVVRTEQEKLNAMVESMAEGVVMTDRDYRVLVANPAVRRAVGLSNDPNISIFDFIDRLDGAFDIRGRLEESVKLDKILVSDDVRISGKFYQVLVAPVKGTLEGKKNEILGGVVIFHDITETKLAEKLREEFTSMMVHELRSPLDAIKKMVEAIVSKKNYLDTSMYNKYLSLIHDNSSRMFTLVNDLLDVAKLETGKFEVIKKPSNLGAIIKSTVELFRASAKDANISLSDHIDPKLPDNITLDPERIIQVLSNLLSNSLKFTESEGKIMVAAFVHKKGSNVEREAKLAGIEHLSEITGLSDIADAVIVSITDTGIGITKDQMQTLFDKFVQFKTIGLHGQQKGTGLGLAIAKGIVETHGGRIWVRSQEGKGSTFYFTIPL